MRIRTLPSISIAILLSACAAPTQHPVATSGSKSDATVTLTAEFSPNGERPNWGNALNTAKDRCAAWGYVGAEALGAVFQSCTLAGSYGTCIRYRESVTYQCTGSTN
jgi:hypothetical protein